jgi:hypothetical protein
MSRLHNYLLIAIAFSVAGILLPSASSFAQQNKNDTQLNSTSTNLPILEQTSEKGIYKVQLKWPQTVEDAQGALQIEIAFLNASAPQATNTTIPQNEGNATGSGTEAGLTVPQVLQDTPLAVKSYDIVVYSNDGKKLWEKIDQPGLGGRGTQRIVLENNNYTGPVTVEINNIRPGWNTGTTTASDLTDSAKFTATIVPEFPIVAMLTLAIGIAATLAAMRLRGRLM